MIRHVLAWSVGDRDAFVGDRCWGEQCWVGPVSVRVLHDGPISFAICGASLHCHANVFLALVFVFAGMAFVCQVLWGIQMSQIPASPPNRSPPPHQKHPKAKEPRNMRTNGANPGRHQYKPSLEVDQEGGRTGPALLLLVFTETISRKCKVLIFLRV